MKSLLIKIRTVFSLGLTNVLRVFLYRASLRMGVHSVCQISSISPRGPFYSKSVQVVGLAQKTTNWIGKGLLFSRWPFPLSDVAPDWFLNPFTGKRFADPARKWWLIPDFDLEIGDIKIIWELSRMDWVLAFAQQARNGDEKSLARLNDWLSDWCNKNPPYLGPNWKCGQEASIRLIHLILAGMILGQLEKPQLGLIQLVITHLKRIAPTIQYAVAQDNNHGISEAAALFIGGSWLSALGYEEGQKWQYNGRYWLENRAARLIGRDGGFSQYSLNYHRMMLDILAVVEVWQRYMQLPEFSKEWKKSGLKAAMWLHHIINEVNGDGPNVGANDGARLIQLTDVGYRDYRESAQIAIALFANAEDLAVIENRQLKEGAQSENQVFEWLGLTSIESQEFLRCSYIDDDCGFAILRRGRAMILLRYPRFKFRPSQSDLLHLDLWLNGDNLLRDAGSYSYSADPKWTSYFNGTASHNTVQFDERDQMPRLGRFLFGAWLKTDFFEALNNDDEKTTFGVGYRDYQGASHKRRVILSSSCMRVIDDLKKFKTKAVMRWRLIPGDWSICSSIKASEYSIECSGTVNGKTHTLTVRSSVPIMRHEIVEGWESRHYFEKTKIPVVEIEVTQPGKLITEYSWAE